MLYSYLNDKDFLLKIDKMQSKEIFVNIISLTWKEQEISNIEGLVTNGTININGNSSVRKTCSLTMQVGENNQYIKNIKELIAIDKKIKLEIGIKNTTNEYLDYDILWFPMGTFIITSVSYTHNLQGISISLNLKDKMCMLNGFCGGTLPSTVTFNEAIDDNNLDETLSIYQIIQELVNHYGGEDLNNIIINDIDTEIRQAIMWNGDSNHRFLVYHIKTDSEDKYTPDWVYAISLSQLKVLIREGKNYFDTVKDNIDDTYVGFKYGTKEDDTQEENIKENNLDKLLKDGKIEDDTGIIYAIDQNEDLGYRYTLFSFVQDLIGQPGENCCTILDKIKNQLGNYEYFYDDNTFIFQEKKNLLNVTAKEFHEEFKNNNTWIDPERYMVQYDSGSSVYDFNDGNIIVSYSNSPQYDKIKNDYMIWGKKSKLRYHLIIDKKPVYGKIQYSYALFPRYPFDELNVEKEIKIISYNEAKENPYYIYKNNGSFFEWRTVEMQRKKLDDKIKYYKSIAESLAARVKILIEKGKSMPDKKIANFVILMQGVLNELTDPIIKFSNDSSGKKEKEAEKEDEKTGKEEEETQQYTLSIVSIKERLETAFSKYPASIERGIRSGKESETYIKEIDKYYELLNNAVEALDKVIYLCERAQYILQLIVFYPDKNIDNLTALNASECLKEASNLISDLTTEEDGPATLAYKELYKYITGYNYGEMPIDNLTDLKAIGFRATLQKLEIDSQSSEAMIPDYFKLDLEKEKIIIVENQVTKDWREELLLQETIKASQNIPTSFYYAELKSEWTNIYDMANHEFYSDFLNSPWNYNFFLDFLDIEENEANKNIQEISKLEVDKIGKRQTVSVVESINCLFEPDPKEIIIINKDDPNAESQKTKALNNNYKPLLLPSEVFDYIAVGGGKNSAHDYIKSMLHEWISYNESITIQCLPIYYLKPNTRIKVEDSSSDIHGEYVISSISIPLSINGNMSIQATRALTRL